MNTVYLIATHMNSEQVARLVKTINHGSPDSIIVIHHDYSASFLDANLFSGLEKIYVLKNRAQIGWGEFSLVEMTLRAMRWIIQNIEFDWLVFISGQDFPIKPIKEIEYSLKKTHYDGFISGVPITTGIPCGINECKIHDSNEKVCNCCIDRYCYNYYSLPEMCYSHQLTARILRRFLYSNEKKINKLQPLIRLKQVPYNRSIRYKIGIVKSLDTTPKTTIHKGSQWFSINYKCVEYILAFLRNNPNFISYYARTIIPDESFFHTILLNCQKLKLHLDNKRYIVWKNPDVKSPNILKMSDLKDIISSNKHFARKFDITIDATILDMIQEHIKEREMLIVNSCVRGNDVNT
jgi:hypothetical protein